MSFKFQTDSVVGKDGEGKVDLGNGASLPSGTTIDLQGSINVSGISTVSIISATSSVVTGVVTATNFVGDGSGLTGLTTTTASKNIAYHYIFADPPLRS